MLVASSILPVLWTLSPHPLWILAAYALGGCVWGGFNLSVFNFVYDAATPAKRARCLAYFNVINGCGVSLGAFTGGWLLSVLPPIGGSRFATLFYCSAALRAAGSILFARAVREVRPVSQAGLRQVIYDLVGQRVIHVLGLVPDDPDDGDPPALT
jgi:MFS family permease